MLLTTFQDFDIVGTGSPYASGNHVPGGPDSELVSGGLTGDGQFIRLAYQEDIPSHNSIAFVRTDVGTFDLIIADFDFRMAPGLGRADGIGFTLLNTAEYGISGVVPPEGPLFAAEEPNFAGSLGIGFNIHDAAGPNEFSNTVSIHYDGRIVSEFDATPAVDLAGGQWIHARITIRLGVGFSDVSVVLSQCGSQPVTLVDQFHIPGLSPYEGRVHFAGRSGGFSADQDLDNVNVQFLDLEQSVLSFSTGCHSVVETEFDSLITITRDGDSSGTVSVQYATSDITAGADSDYNATSGTLTFVPNETTKSFTVPLLNDSLTEGDESFNVSLSNPTGGAVVGGPSIANVTIIDDELSSIEGHWGGVFHTQVVAVHAHLLPTGKVLFWNGDDGEGDTPSTTFEDPRLWDPVTGTIEIVPPPPHNLFCAGHAFLPDGRLLITGGHLELNVGLPDAAIYDPFNNTWSEVPDMNDGRWYPTNTTLANGDVLVMSGAISNDPYTVNNLTQVFETQTNTWRDLPNAAFGFDWHLYPMSFQAPSGSVFVAGPDQVTHFIDTVGTGARTDGPSSNFGIRTNGSAVMYDAGRILMMGGDNAVQTPTDTAEIIDLNALETGWQYTDSMAYARQYHNSTLMPDGTVLVTGGTTSDGFNDSTSAVLPAEMWNPVTGLWTTLAAMEVPRVYHSTALLLPDGRVYVSGGGQPSPAPAHNVNNLNAEIYSPPYLFHGTRPSITSAPTGVTYGDTFFVQTPDATNIAAVNWIRLSSVTHAFNQNQRINHLNFSMAPGGLNVIAPSEPNLAPPGHYMLFILDDQGVPSVSNIIQIGVDTADLSITVSDSPDPVVAGNNLTYTITVSNAGPSDAQNVQVVDTLAAGTTFVSDTDSCVEAPAGRLTCSLGTISAGGNTNFDITVAVDPSVDDGTVLTNSATVSSTTTDPNAGNETATEDTSVNTVNDTVGRLIFYNDSSFDGANDDHAIAPDKTALLPGQTASFQNYSSYSRGINGIMVDIANMANPMAVTSADFAFRVGNDNNPDGWASAPTPASVTVREGAGEAGSDRVTITWADNAIENTWLQVTVLPTVNTGLLSPEVHYWGNAVGDSGNAAESTQVNATDELNARFNQHDFLDPALLDDFVDYNRDARVNATDELIARFNQTNFLTDLNLISVPAAPAAAETSVVFADAIHVFDKEFDPNRNAAAQQTDGTESDHSTTMRNQARSRQVRQLIRRRLLSTNRPRHAEDLAARLINTGTGQRDAQENTDLDRISQDAAIAEEDLDEWWIE